MCASWDFQRVIQHNNPGDSPDCRPKPKQSMHSQKAIRAHPNKDYRWQYFLFQPRPPFITNWYIFELVHNQALKIGDNWSLLFPSSDFRSLGNLGRYKPVRLPLGDSNSTVHTRCPFVSQRDLFAMCSCILELNYYLIQPSETTVTLLTKSFSPPPWCVIWANHLSSNIKQTGHLSTMLQNNQVQCNMPSHIMA